MTPSPLKGPERTKKTEQPPADSSVLKVECWGMKLGKAHWNSHCWLEVNPTSSWDQLSRCHLSHLTAFPDLPPGEFNSQNITLLVSSQAAPERPGPGV